MLRAKPDRSTRPVDDPRSLTHERLVREYERLAKGMTGMKKLFLHQREHTQHQFQRGLIDRLTGLHNRSYFHQRLTEEVARSRRQHTPMGIVYIDGDHFKNINDTYGHPMGDKTIKLLAKIIKSRMRESDTAFRLGGDEFAIILPGANLVDTIKFAKTLRVNVNETYFVFDKVDIDKTQPGGKFTISLGVTSYSHDMNIDSPKAHPKEWSEMYHVDIAKKLIETADNALYDAKTLRNCVKARTYGNVKR
jgi:diguanylate cyclase (GGDEF)-like protein